MDWKWVWLVLLLLVIAAAVWLLLRRPGGTNEVSGTSDPELRPHTNTDTAPPAQAGGYAAGSESAAGPGAPAQDQQAAAPYDQAGSAPFDQQAGAQPAQDAGYQQHAGDAQDAGTQPGAGYPEAGQTDYIAEGTADAPASDGGRSSDYAYTDTQPAAEVSDYSQEATYTDTATGEVGQADTVAQGEAPADTTYGQAPAGDAYGQAPAGDAYGQAPVEDTAYAAEPTDPVTQGAEATDPATGYAYTDTAPAAEAGDYSQEATYTDTATGEVAQADTVPAETDSVDPTYGQAAPADGTYTEAPADGTYTEAPADGTYTEAPYTEAPATDDGSGVSGGAVAAGAGAAAAGAGATAWATSRDDDAAQTAEGAPAGDTNWGQGEPVQTSADFGADESGAAATEAGYAEPRTDAVYAETTDTTYAEEPVVDTGAPPAGTTYGQDAPASGAAPEASPGATADTGDYGYDEARAGAAAGSYAQGPFGTGSAEPGEDGSGPTGWSIKGNAGSMLFHTPESPSYEAARAEVWFETEEAAKAAGFAHWDRKQR
ncbi:hypothetical protein NF556_19205 [Ornithinimicrobium faecis]|uniref:Membrane protein ArfC n=1 Tax=Ornithinimicrobium faecis TaxID=2934158 RepID=A0ABY4YSF2_9MICO|nr:hypothetical protein [Ornithinimicrobium sp. HY1793]USQ79689.1 hypothetical protein NF556_19205 [Ornithinimicrobium sp. HY1793]